MIVGEYNDAKYEATVEVEVGGGVGYKQMITAVLDTGFTGYLMLPQSVADAIQPRYIPDATVILGDGNDSTLPRCEVEVKWDGQTRRVQAYISRRADPLIGMKLLRGSLVTLELVTSGSVTIERAE